MQDVCDVDASIAVCGDADANMKSWFSRFSLDLTQQLISITRSAESNPSYFLGELVPWWRTWLSKIDEAEIAQLRGPIYRIYSA